jgi:dTMP kinase
MTDAFDPAAERRTARLVSLAGLDGAGKTTQVALLGRWLSDCGYSVAVEAPPGPSLTRKTLTEMAAQRGVEDFRDVFGPDVTHLITAFMRYRDWTERVLPALSTHQWVLTDRSAVCHYAAARADGAGNEADLRLVLGRLPQPDLLIYLDVPPGEALGRLNARGSGLEHGAFLLANEQGYRTLPEFGTFEVVSGTGSAGSVQSRLRAAVRRRFGAAGFGGRHTRTTAYSRIAKK